MHFLEQFYYKIIKYQLINKFSYDNLEELPKLNKISLNMGYNSAEIEKIGSNLLALEFITKQKGVMELSKDVNITLKIKKGNLMGCRVTLRKRNMLNLLDFLLIKTNSNFFLQYCNILKKFNTLKYKIKDPLIFPGIEKNYQFFHTLPGINITIVAILKDVNKKDFFFFLVSLKLSIL